MKKIIIVGGGFAGINAAKTLGKSRRSDIEITLIDKRNHHLFQPLLYQVATAGLSPADIAAPIRKVLSPYKNTKVVLGEVLSIDPDEQTLQTNVGPLSYDTLILACGATHSYFGNNQWEHRAPGLKSIEQATEIRRRILLAFEKAELTTDPEQRKALMTFVIVGGGPTGVELAGAIGEIARFTLSKNFRNIDPSKTRIILIEGGKNVLSAFDPSLSESAQHRLEQLGVSVWTSMRVTNIDEKGVWIGEEHLKAETILWAAGIQASALNTQLPDESDRIGRIKVQPDLSLSSHSNIFVVGDQAHVANEKTESVPPLAPAAIQQGVCAANNILLEIDGKPRKDFVYFDKGMMATIGRSAAIAQTGNLKLKGFVAWVAWCFVHILYLIGFRNRLLVMMQWAWSYFQFNRGARLITQKEWRMLSQQKKES